MAVLKVAIDGRDAQRGGGTVQRALDGIVSKVGAVSKAFDTAATSAQRTYGRMGSAAKTAFHQTSAGLKELDGHFISAQRSANNFADRIVNVRNVVAGGILGVAVNSLIDAQIQFEKVNSQLKAVTGSAGGANREFTYVSQTVRELGLNFGVTAKSYANFAASTRNTNLEGAETQRIFTAVAEAARVLNLDAMDTEGVFRALSQMISKGNVQAEELRGQLGDRLPGAFKLAADALGVTTSELNAMLKAGEVAAEDLLPKLATELHKTFGPDAKEASNQLSASLQRVNFQWKNLLTSIATAGGGLSGGAGTLEKVLGGWAVMFGNALDPADALNTKILALKAELRTAEALDFFPAQRKEAERLRKELENLEKIQRKALGLGAEGADTKEDIAKRLAAKNAKNGPKPLTESQQDTIADLIIDINKSTDAFNQQAQSGLKSAAAIAMIEAKAKLLKAGIKELTPEIEKALGRQEGARQSSVSATMARQIEEQARALRAQTAAGVTAGQAMVEYSAKQQLAEQGVKKLTPAVQASVRALQDAQRAAAESDLAQGLRDQIAELNAMTAAGPAAASAQQKLRLETELAKYSVNGLTTELKALLDQLLASQARASEASILEQLKQETEEFRIQATAGHLAAEMLERYALSSELAKTQTSGLNKEIERQIQLRNQQKDSAYIASLQEELRLSQMSSVERAREEAQRKLSSAATTGQREQVDQLSEAIARNTRQQKFNEEVALQAARNIHDAFVDFLMDPLNAGFDGLVHSFAQTLQRMAAEALASSFFKIIGQMLSGYGASAGGGWGAFLSGLGSAFGGGKAEGGATQPGKSYLVGEQGPEVVNFDRAGTVIPNDVLQAAVNGFGGGAPNVKVPVSISNVLDPGMLPAAMESEKGSQAILNVIRMNPEAIRQALG